MAHLIYSAGGVVTWPAAGRRRGARMLGDYDAVPPEILERDALGRGRLPLDEIAFAGSWGRSFQP